MWLDIRVWLCGWTKSLLTSYVGVCVILSIRDCGRVVVVGLPVLKRQDLGLGDPKLSLLRLWGQSSCCFQLLNYTSSSVLRTPSSIHLYTTKSSLKDALSLVSLAGDMMGVWTPSTPSNTPLRHAQSTPSTPSHVPLKRVRALMALMACTMEHRHIAHL